MKILAEFASCASYFLNLELKRNFELISKHLHASRVARELEETKVREVHELFAEVYVSQYAYECVTCFFNENAKHTEFCREVVQRSVKHRSIASGATPDNYVLGN